MPDSTAPPPTADAVVVGGGVMGASIAYHLARAGAGRVVLLEKRFLAAGSTGKSGAICRQHYSNVLTATMAKRSLEIFTNFDDAIGGDCGFVRTGFIAVVSPEDRDGLAVNLELQRSVGIDTRSVSPDELCAIDPQAAATDVGAACYEPDAGYADPVLTTASFAEAAQRHGAIICEGTPLMGIVREGDRIGGVQTPKGTISTRVVVNAAGPWARRVMGMVGEDIPCDVARVQAAIYRRPPDFGAPHAVYGDFIHQIYFKPHGGAQTQVGSIDPAEAKNRADPDDYDEGIESDFITACRERMAKRLPIMAQSIAGGGLVRALHADAGLAPHPGPCHPGGGAVRRHGLQRSRLQALARGRRVHGRVGNRGPGHDSGHLAPTREPFRPGRTDARTVRV